MITDLWLSFFQVRKVEYVDKKEEEWEEFQKMIVAETKVLFMFIFISLCLS